MGQCLPVKLSMPFLYITRITQDRCHAGIIFFVCLPDDLRIPVASQILPLKSALEVFLGAGYTAQKALMVEGMVCFSFSNGSE